MKWELRPLEKGKVVGGVEATSLEDVGCGQKYLNANTIWGKYCYHCNIVNE